MPWLGNCRHAALTVEPALNTYHYLWICSLLIFDSSECGLVQLCACPHPVLCFSFLHTSLSLLAFDDSRSLTRPPCFFLFSLLLPNKLFIFHLSIFHSNHISTHRFHHLPLPVNPPLLSPTSLSPPSHFSFLSHHSFPFSSFFPLPFFLPLFSLALKTEGKKG